MASCLPLCKCEMILPSCLQGSISQKFPKFNTEVYQELQMQPIDEVAIVTADHQRPQTLCSGAACTAALMFVGETEDD